MTRDERAPRLPRPRLRAGRVRPHGAPATPGTTMEAHASPADRLTRSCARHTRRARRPRGDSPRRWLVPGGRRGLRRAHRRRRLGRDPPGQRPAGPDSTGQQRTGGTPATGSSASADDRRHAAHPVHRWSAREPARLLRRADRPQQADVQAVPRVRPGPAFPAERRRRAGQGLAGRRPSTPSPTATPTATSSPGRARPSVTSR